MLALYFVAPSRVRNELLLLASLLFYAWGEPRFALVMLASIAANFGFGLWVDRVRDRPAATWVMALAVVFNVGLLVVYKYATFLVGNLNGLLAMLGIAAVRLKPIALPIGISFFTFQAFSYVIDVYRRAGPVQRNPVNIALYVTLFPQLIAGPIVRYHDVARQIVDRTVTVAGFALGVRRFVIGLGKKVLVANTVAVSADAIFGLPADQLTPALAWLGVLCYTIQIYFDFSGYSDMAIGLGHMFGFHFLENFDYPYVARSLTEFWRRWHISLSTWFRDYLYIPLGGSRHGPRRTYVNLVTVFFLCGLWHGASWTFVVWGLFHGGFLVAERLRLGSWLARAPSAVRHAYVLLVVMVGWVLFRAPSLGAAWTYLLAMAGWAHGAGIEHHLLMYVDWVRLLALAGGAFGAVPLLPLVGRWRERIVAPVPDAVMAVAGLAGLGFVLVASAMLLAAGTYNPFIYFRF